MAATRRSCARTPLQKGLLLLSLALALLLCAACTADASRYTSPEVLHTRNFLLSLTKSIPALAEHWNPSADLCSWKHVSCMSDGIELVLSNLHLYGTLPELDVNIDGSMVHIFTLDLNANPGVVGTLPASWGSLNMLQRLRIEGTGISGTLPAEWSRMTLLSELALDRTHITGTLPWQWSSMKNLRKLTLSSTAVFGTLPADWAQMDALETIALANTAISGTLPVEWADLDLLIYIDVSGTAVSGTLPAEWKAFTELWFFSAANTAINGTLPAEWESMTLMRVLRLHSTALYGTIPSSWGSMTQLEEINVAHTQLSGCVPMPWLQGRFLSTAETSLTSSLTTHCLTSTRAPAEADTPVLNMHDGFMIALILWIVIAPAVVAMAAFVHRSAPTKAQAADTDADLCSALDDDDETDVDSCAEFHQSEDEADLV